MANIGGSQQSSFGDVFSQIPSGLSLKPVARGKPVSMVKPFKRENPGDPGKDSPSKKIKSSPPKKSKLSEDLFKADVVDNPPKELSKVDKKVGEVLLTPDPQPLKDVKKKYANNLAQSKNQTEKVVDFDALTSKTDVSEKESSETTKTSENQCADCKKIMKTPKSLIDHKKKFRCPGKTQIDEDLKANNILPGEHTLEEALPVDIKQKTYFDN